MYSKGANMLHTLRQLVDSDSLWRELLRGLNVRFYHQTVTTQEVEEYISEFTGIRLEAFFNQYLRDTRIPVLEYEINGLEMKYKWTNCVEGFDMPVRIWLNGALRWIRPTTGWNKEPVEDHVEHARVDENFYVASMRIQPLNDGHE
jgi:aminopeptidase N